MPPSPVAWLAMVLLLVGDGPSGQYQSRRATAVARRGAGHAPCGVGAVPGCASVRLARAERRARSVPRVGSGGVFRKSTAGRETTGGSRLESRGTPNSGKSKAGGAGFPRAGRAARAHDPRRRPRRALHGCRGASRDRNEQPHRVGAAARVRGVPDRRRIGRAQRRVAFVGVRAEPRTSRSRGCRGCSRSRCLPAVLRCWCSIWGGRTGSWWP